MSCLKRRPLGPMLVLLLLAACSSRPDEKKAVADEAPATAPLFSLLSPAQTRVQFTNTVTESPYANIFSYQYFYNGGGVAIADLNRDGLPDIYFSGNQVSNKLYLNHGSMKFEDVTAFAGVAGAPNSWKTGVTIADVNGDSLPDIYQCYSGPLPGTSRMNQLLINEGPDKNGIPVFRDRAKEYGLADSAFSTQAVFFDYDRDGDLDMFLLNHNPAPFNTLDATSINEILKKPAPNMQAKLYRNEGAAFTDVSAKAGLANSAFSYGLGVGVGDVNADGWPDLYVSNDYSAPDYLLINNRNGTFTDRLKNSIGHTSLYSMGNDVADINNDGLPDIVSLDMLPEDNRRQKLLFGPDNYEYFDLVVGAGFHSQYMRNMLQLNNGDGSFSEIGQMAGISNTDWSWAPLLADYDNDGWKDLFVSNGFLKDFTNMDFIKFRGDYFKYLGGKVTPQSVMDVLGKMPASNVTNYLFQNNGNLQFQDKSKAWGFTEASNSNGAAYADLDNDGDLDLVINNINQPAFLYQNNEQQATRHGYLDIKLAGSGKNTAGIGARVFLYTKGQVQYAEQAPGRGYQSSVTPLLHFGLGNEPTIDSLKIIWPRGREQRLQNVKAGQLLTLSETEAAGGYKYGQEERPVFIQTASPVSFTHLGTTLNDFKRQPLLVNPESVSGPCMAKGDVNGDGLEDLFVGGATGQAGALFLQQKDGGFIRKPTAGFEADKASDDVDALFFDANGDKALDLYVASGGYHHFSPGDSALQDRLYINDGKGGFRKNVSALPAMPTSTACVRAGDINGDGKPDLFVGGKVVPGRYPEPPRSYILLNKGNGVFEDRTTQVAPGIEHLGMVSDAAWVDLNSDGRAELVVVGEWMPVTVFVNKNGKLDEKTTSFFPKKYSGWWNKILVGDFNGDQHPDLIVGNAGLNAQCKATDQQPAEMWYKDFDDNGAVDPILCFYIKGKSYPYVTRDELLDQLSSMRTRFPDYASYADASLQQVFTAEELEGAGHLTANCLQTMYFVGSAGGALKEAALPLEVQMAPVMAAASFDYDGDGVTDVLLAGNTNRARLRFGKSDANHGILLKGDGKGGFRYLPQGQSGFRLQGDVRSLVMINGTVLAGINGAPVAAYKMQR